jgi:hypothetical protein
VSHRVHREPRDSENSVHDPRREITCDSFPFKQELPNRVEAETPSTSLDQQTPTTSTTNRQGKIRNTRKTTETRANQLQPNGSKQPSKMSALAPNGAATTAAPAANDARDPSGFLSEIIGAPVTVKLNSGVVYKGKTERF